MRKKMLSKTAVIKLQAALDYITLHPEEWDQGVWMSTKSSAPASPGDQPCGTVCCVAGRLVLNAPKKFKVTWTFHSYPTGGGWDGGGDARLHKLGAESSVGYEFRDAAREILGIDDGDLRAFDILADMFRGDNTLRQVWKYGQRLAEGRLSVPENFRSGV